MQVPLDQIRCDGNIRTQVDEAQIAGLAQTMRLVGQQVPVRGRMVDGRCVLTDGMRRFLAARKLGWQTLEVILEKENLGESDLLQRQLIANCQRADLPVLDKARAVRRLMEVSECNASEAAARLGTSNASITRLLSLLALPEDIQQQIAAGKIAPSTAYELARAGDRQAELAQAAAQGQLTREAVQSRRRPSRSRQAKKRPSSRTTLQLTAGRSLSISGPSLSLETLIELLEECLAKARKGKSQNWELGTLARALKDQDRSQ